MPCSNFLRFTINPINTAAMIRTDALKHKIPELLYRLGAWGLTVECLGLRVQGLRVWDIYRV